MRRTRTIHGQSAPKCSNAILGDSNKSFADNQKLGRGGGDRRDTPNSKSHRSMALQPLLSAIVDFVDLGEPSICTFPITRVYQALVCFSAAISSPLNVSVG